MKIFEKKLIELIKQYFANPFPLSLGLKLIDIKAIFSFTSNLTNEILFLYAPSQIIRIFLLQDNDFSNQFKWFSHFIIFESIDI